MDLSSPRTAIAMTMVGVLGPRFHVRRDNVANRFVPGRDAAVTNPIAIRAFTVEAVTFEIVTFKRVALDIGVAIQSVVVVPIQVIVGTIVIVVIVCIAIIGG